MKSNADKGIVSFMQLLSILLEVFPNFTNYVTISCMTEFCTDKFTIKNVSKLVTS